MAFLALVLVICVSAGLGFYFLVPSEVPDDPPAPRLGAERVDSIPGSKVGPGSNYGSIDLASSDGRTLHLVAAAYVPSTGGSTWYQRSDDGGRSWSPRAALVPTGRTSPRIFVSDHLLHVLTGPGSGHFVSKDRGGSWTFTGDLSAGTGAFVGPCDAVAIGDTLVVVYSVSTDGSTTDETDRTLYSVRWAPGVVPRPRVIGRFTDVSYRHFGPQIARLGSTLHVLTTRHRTGIRSRKVRGSTIETPTMLGSLVSWSSRDCGRTWSARTSPMPQDSTTWLYDLEVITIGERLALLSSGTVAFGAASDSGGIQWLPPASVSQKRRGIGLSDWGRGFDAVGDTGRMAFTWIDERYQRTDQSREGVLRRGPLILISMGIVPWANNDVFALPVEAGNDFPGAVARAGPVRLSRDLTSAFDVQAEFVGDELVCVWSGNAHADAPGRGRRPDQLFSARVPPEYFGR